MADDENVDAPVGNSEEQFPFAADRAKSGRATCKKCKQKIETGTLRLAKIVPNPYGTGVMKSWHHVSCMFEVFSKQRKTTRKIETVDDIEGWDDLKVDDQEEILSSLPNSARIRKNKPSPTKAVAVTTPKLISNRFDEMHKDNSFREFRRLCADVANASSYLTKTAIVKEFFTSGSGKDGFKGDLLLWCRLLLPGFIKRVYNLQSKQLIKLFSGLFSEDQDEMLEDLEQGDVAETISVFFEKNKKILPAKKSLLTLQEVDKFLDRLSNLTKEEDQMEHFGNITKKCTANDLKMIIRLVKSDLRINAGAKHILDAVHPDAYQAFQASRDISCIITQATQATPTVGTVMPKNMNVGVNLLTPLLPMLASPCKSVAEAMKKCPNGFYSEIKYDGERVQVHKKGSEFKYFSRQLKTVIPYKVKPFKDLIPQAFPSGSDLILDSEILMVDLDTGTPLPFGSLGVHKRLKYKNSAVCLFVFDCVYYNGASLLHKPMKERRRILEENMVEIKNRIMFSDLKEIHDPKGLEEMLTEVFRKGLEGLVLKDLLSVYEPGKRHWLKMKKDYLMDGAMADTADLVVLGAWYGTGQKGGIMSTFLMGCYDEQSGKFCTVTKVHTGLDNNQLNKLQNELDMVKIVRAAENVPSWLNCKLGMIPNFVARDPKAQPVWEITGAEFTKNERHTASISVRFPRITRFRSDKDWKTATSLAELEELFRKSKDTANFTLTIPSTSEDLSSKDTSNFTLAASTSPRREGSRSPSPRQRGSRSPSPKRRRSRSPSPKRKSKNSPASSESSTSATTPQNETPSPPLSKKKRTLETFNSSSMNFKTDVMDITGTKTFKRDIVTVDADESPRKKLKVLKRSLPDVFVGVKLALPGEGLPTRELLERYFIAYGGELLPEEKAEEATHCIVTQNTKKYELIQGAENVDVAWLWDSIKLQKLQNTLMYTRNL